MGKNESIIVEELNQRMLQLVLAFRSAIDYREPYKTGHSERVTKYTAKLGKALNLNKKKLNVLKYASYLHDIGKIGVDESVLKCPGELSPEGEEAIQKHVIIAKSILNPIKEFKDIIPVILYHHERWDGKGYPEGLKGEEIPIESRIISVVDTYDALITERPHRKKYTYSEAVKMMKSLRNKQLDGRIVDCLVGILEKER